MRKTFKWLPAVGAAVILSVLAPNGVSASASVENGQTQEQNTSQWTQDQGFQDFLHNVFRSWGDNGQEEQVEVEQTEQPNTEAPAPEQPQEDVEQSGSNDEQAESDLNQFEQEVVDLTNQEREKQGLAPLKIDTELSKSAREKSRDMQENGYFDHNSPTYGSPFDMMEAFGIDYQTAGENIAKGQPTPEEVVNAWMNSEGHRENILNGSFTHIGVGYNEDGNVWTQQFIGK